MNVPEPAVKISAEVLENPALLFLYHRIKQVLGIKAESAALFKLNEYLEKCSGDSFVKNPAAFETLLTSRERIYEISNLLTINETYFFREGVHFELLLRFLPQFAGKKRPLHICSAATSIGCEAYSIAMLLDHHLKNEKKPDFDYAIDAFDVSAEAIETAKNARYTANTLRTDGSAWKHILNSYLVPDNGEYFVSQNIRGKVRFFTHNIMHGLNKQYDVIFFRNALIYFSSKNRLLVLDDLAKSLFDNGLLFMGISETSAVKHPLLESRCLSDAFYFQKITVPVYSTGPELKPKAGQMTRHPVKKEGAREEKQAHNNRAKPVEPKRAELPIDCREVAAILEMEEGQTNAKKMLEVLSGAPSNALSGGISAGRNSPRGSELAAAAVYFLGTEDFNSADLVLSFLEKCNTGAFTRFLRGEYYFRRDSAKDAEGCFEDAAGKDRTFWPAYYRIASMAAGGNRTRYEYKVKKACESLELGREYRYECFLGGFSPDYFRRILEKKLA